MDILNMVDIGEHVEKTTTTVEKLNSKWAVKVDVHYTGSHYNLAVEIYKKGLFSSEGYSDIVRVDNKTNLESKSEEIVENLFEVAADKRDARNVSLDITVK